MRPAKPADTELLHKPTNVPGVCSVCLGDVRLTPDAPQPAQPRSAWLCRALLIAATAIGLPHNASARSQTFDFNIPAQPLAAALERYSQITGRDALYNSNLTAGLRSAEVRGSLSPDMALSLLLAGTGLNARAVTSTSFALYRVATPSAPSPAVQTFYGRLQTSLRSTLCADPFARPGGYRLAVRLWLGRSGRVVKHERLGSTGADDTDTTIDRRLSQLAIGAPPPPDLAQPVTVIIRPQTAGVTMGCS